MDSEAIKQLCVMNRLRFKGILHLQKENMLLIKYMGQDTGIHVQNKHYLEYIATSQHYTMSLVW